MDFRPVPAELLLFLGSPISQDFFGEFRRLVEMSAPEIEHEWALDHRHVNGPKLIVPSEKLRNMAYANFCHLVFLQPQIDVSFPKKGLFAFVDLDRRTPAVDVTLGDEYDTMNAATQLLPKLELVGSSINLCPGNKFIMNRHNDVNVNGHHHSAVVRMELHINGQILSIGQLGPDFIMLDDPTDHSPGAAEIAMWVDGHPSRWPVYLVDGVASGQEKTRIA